MAITLVGAWSLQGSTTNYGNSASLASPAVNVPAGALIATGCSITNGIVPSVSDTAGNTYTVLPLFSGTATSTQDVYVAYCLSAVANTANVVTWSATGQNVQGNNGAVYSTSSGTWAYDTDVSGEQGVGYGTNLDLSITTAGAGLIAGLFFEYYAQAQQPWTLTGLTQQAVTQDTSTGTGAPGNVYGDAITTAAQTAYAISATDGSAGLGGGKVTGFAVSFVVASSANTVSVVTGGTPASAILGAQSLSSQIAAMLVPEVSILGAQSLSSQIAAMLVPEVSILGVQNISVLVAIRTAGASAETAVSAFNNYANAAARFAAIQSGTPNFYTNIRPAVAQYVYFLRSGSWTVPAGTSFYVSATAAGGSPLGTAGRQLLGQSLPVTAGDILTVTIGPNVLIQKGATTLLSLLDGSPYTKNTSAELAQNSNIAGLGSGVDSGLAYPACVVFFWR